MTKVGCRHSFVCFGMPIGKPRMTRSDRWKKRPCVVRYWAFCDALRMAAGLSDKVTFVRPHTMHIVAYFPIPASWPKRIKDLARGMPHSHKPDVDNIEKGVMDALLKKDQNIYDVRCEKYWDDGRGARIEVTLGEQA